MGEAGLDEVDDRAERGGRSRGGALSGGHQISPGSKAPAPRQPADVTFVPLTRAEPVISWTGTSIPEERMWGMAKTQKPGEKPAKPAEYIERGPQGGKVPGARQVTIEPGDDRLPPTQKPGRVWEPIGPPRKGK